MTADGDGRTSTSQSLERGLAILTSFSVGTAAASASASSLASSASRGARRTATSPRSRASATSTRTTARGSTRSARESSISASRRSTRWSCGTSRRHHLQRLCDETGHTVNMAILDDVDIVYVERFRASRRGQNEIDLDLHVGSRLPAYCTSLGKVLLAFLPDSARDDVLDAGSRSLVAARTRSPRRPRCSPSSAGSAPPASRSTTRSSPTGSARSPCRCSPPTGEAVAAVNLAAHRTMASLDDLVARIGPLMQRTAAEISAQLGYRAARPGGGILRPLRPTAGADEPIEQPCGGGNDSLSEEQEDRDHERAVVGLAKLPAVGQRAVQEAERRGADHRAEQGPQCRRAPR